MSSLNTYQEDRLFLMRTSTGWTTRVIWLKRNVCMNFWRRPQTMTMDWNGDVMDDDNEAIEGKPSHCEALTAAKTI
jgi:hypothetical protein